MLNGLDLFSGYGGITLGLKRWVRPLAYCEANRYAQSIILSRQADGDLPKAPIWNDVKTLDGKNLKGEIDIIYGGFPCQDISVAGNGAGLEGERSGLFYEVERLVKEIKPPFVFLENVPAIRTRGLLAVVNSFAKMGYDCRWTCISASYVGAPHKRERWFLLAHAKCDRGGTNARNNRPTEEERAKLLQKDRQTCANDTEALRGNLPHASRPRAYGGETLGGSEEAIRDHEKRSDKAWHPQGSNPQRMLSTNKTIRPQEAWEIEPDVGRVADGTPYRVDRIKALGNGVVPLQVEVAFRKLIGLADKNA